MNVVSFSGGKDSTAMLLMMLERGIQVDRIINVDTTKEFPQMYDHIKKVESYIGQKIETVKIDFDYWFSEHIITKGKNKGKRGYGWPCARARWCTGKKVKAFQKLLTINSTVYIGLAFDEKHRAEKNKNDLRSYADTIYPLIEWEITEKEALQYCYSKGFDWGGLYEEGHPRVSCFCCPLQKIGTLKLIHDNHPDLWKEMNRMDKFSSRSFRSDYSFQELTAKFTSSQE